VVEVVSRIYWFTVEFGLSLEADKVQIYGAGILSSSGESGYSLGETPERVPYSALEVIRTAYIKDKFQEKYFVIESYKQLYDSVREIEEAILGELKNGTVEN
jgi:phenylalanine-4-hydroxylase